MHPSSAACSTPKNEGMSERNASPSACAILCRRVFACLREPRTCAPDRAKSGLYPHLATQPNAKLSKHSQKTVLYGRGLALDPPAIDVCEWLHRSFLSVRPAVLLPAAEFFERL